MLFETFRQALTVCEDYDTTITIGGGEPTLHRHFEKMLLEAMGAKIDGNPFIITNGTQTRISLILARLAQNNIIEAELSQDEFHDYDMVDPEVRKAFQGRYRNVTAYHDPIPVGRYRETIRKESGGNEKLFRENIRNAEKGSICCCYDWVVYPNGDVSQCGCPDSPIVGTVWDLQPGESGCYKEIGE